MGHLPAHGEFAATLNACRHRRLTMSSQFPSYHMPLELHPSMESRPTNLGAPESAKDSSYCFGPFTSIRHGNSARSTQATASANAHATFVGHTGKPTSVGRLGGMMTTSSPSVPERSPRAANRPWRPRTPQRDLRWSNASPRVAPAASGSSHLGMRQATRAE